ncbi:MAG TPA: 3-hydroxyacyl-ACP dehydratase FabZ [Microthrixaceae bacterium]|nr:3-hydroxyacyl-ACP dehydratase FabZ [Microthrixaceae bacterium]
MTSVIEPTPAPVARDTGRPTVLTASRRIDAGELQRLLPHAWPFLMLDAVTNLEPGVRGEAIKCVTNAEWAIHGHFPGEPILPGVLLIEAAAQLCGIVTASASEPGASPSIGYLASVKRFRLRSLVQPGDQVRIEAHIERQRSRLAEFRVTARVAGRVCADGALMIRLG